MKSIKTIGAGKFGKYGNVIGRVWVKQHSFLLLYTIEPKSPDLQPTLAVENEKQVEEEEGGKTS